MVMTPAQFKEFAKCRKDPAYFINNYCFIQHPTQGVIPFRLYDFQYNILQDYMKNRFCITNKSRQTGISTITACYALWLALFYKNKTITIISIKDDDAKEFLKKIKLAFEMLPDWMAEEPITDNVHNLHLTSGSTITSVASGSQAARGRAVSLLIIDECAFIDHIEDIWTAAYPTLSRGGNAILISTPNGIGNFFYKTWQYADKDAPSAERNEFHRIFVHWTQIPEYRGFEDIPEDWTFEKIKEEAMNQEWFQQTRKQFDDRKWAQEFEGDFLGSGNTVVDQTMLKETRDIMEDPKWRFDTHWNEVEFGDLWVWEAPDPTKYYCIGIDIASGSGTDFSTMQVLDLYTGEQVAEYQGKIDMMSYAKFAAELGRRYNDALLIPENTGMGIGMVQKLVLEVGYEHIFQTQNEKTMKANKSAYGWSTTATTRPLLVQAVVNYFNERQCKWRSKRLWKELASFVWKDNGKAEADTGNNDDLVLAMAIAAHNRERALQQMPVGLGHEFARHEDDIVRDMWGDEIKPKKQEVEGDALYKPREDLDMVDWLRS